MGESIGAYFATPHNLIPEEIPRAARMDLRAAALGILSTDEAMQEHVVLYMPLMRMWNGAISIFNGMNGYMPLPTHVSTEEELSELELQLEVMNMMEGLPRFIGEQIEHNGVSRLIGFYRDRLSRMYEQTVIGREARLDEAVSQAAANIVTRDLGAVGIPSTYLDRSPKECLPERLNTQIAPSEFTTN